jgi:hypothetical protein
VKVIRFIVAVYVLAIVLYPCGDPDTCADELKLGAGITAHSNHNADEMDLCSPFCSCSCCAAQIQFKATAFVTNLNQVHSKQLPAYYLDRPELQRCNNIWQPPKLA